MKATAGTIKLRRHQAPTLPQIPDRVKEKVRQRGAEIGLIAATATMFLVLFNALQTALERYTIVGM